MFLDRDWLGGTRVTVAEELCYLASHWVPQTQLEKELMDMSRGLRAPINKQSRYTKCLNKVRARVPQHFENKILNRDLNTLNAKERKLPRRNRGQVFRAKQLKQQRLNAVTATTSLSHDVVYLDHGYAFGTALDYILFKVKYRRLNLTTGQHLCCLGQMGYRCRCSLCKQGTHARIINKVSIADGRSENYLHAVIDQNSIKEENTQEQLCAVTMEIIFE